MDNKRLNKVSRLLQKEFGVYFQQNAASNFESALISVTTIRVSPDLSIAKIYLSIFPNDKIQSVFEKIKSTKSKIKYDLGPVIGKQLRKVPEFDFYIDDSLDYAEKIDKLLEN
ncbi:MAG: 30S ribosome-binding factor RbfA [Bacteroidales bacterium]|nr:30S ribosome-binding factor RbfA [Bacteroidales bacterium]